jgi:hypothetical protein
MALTRGTMIASKAKAKHSFGPERFRVEQTAKTSDASLSREESESRAQGGVILFRRKHGRVWEPGHSSVQFSSVQFSSVHKRDTRVHTGTRITQTNLTTIPIQT